MSFLGEMTRKISTHQTSVLLCQQHLHLRATEQWASSKLMWAVLRSRSSSLHPWKQGIAVPPGLNPTAFSSSSFTTATTNKAFLSLQEIEKVLNDVRADDVKVLSVPNMHADWADYVVLATGRSTWHVKNIAQALIYKAGSPSLLPSFFSFFLFFFLVVCVWLKP